MHHTAAEASRLAQGLTKAVLGAGRDVEVDAQARAAHIGARVGAPVASVDACESRQ